MGHSSVIVLEAEHGDSLERWLLTTISYGRQGEPRMDNTYYIYIKYMCWEQGAAGTKQYAKDRVSRGVGSKCLMRANHPFAYALSVEFSGQ